MKLAIFLALPLLGTTFKPLPPGPAKAKVEAACYACHSADIMVQQRLTEKQWTASVEKMIRWGAEVKDADKAAMIAYLSKHFAPTNTFAPIRTQQLKRRVGADLPPLLNCLIVPSHQTYRRIVMATEKLQARRRVYISVPRGSENDLKKIFKLTESVLGKLGCGGCHSGFDLHWTHDPIFNEKGEQFGG